MARSNTITKLPLDRWAEIIGIHPLHFNQLTSSDLIPGTVCGEVFFQYNWGHSDRVGREDIAQAILAAEKEIEAELGYNLIPDWTAQERLSFSRPGQPGIYNLNGRNPRGQYASVELPRGYVISGGVKTKSLIDDGAAIVRSDDDSDGFQETCTVIVATSVTDENEIRAFYPAKDGLDAWEIRPISVSISGGNATITFKIWQVVAANQLDAFNPEPLNAETASSYETTVDIYRVYNDPATQVQFIWEQDTPFPNCGSGTCYACSLGTQNGCFHNRDHQLGIIVPAPASYDASTEQWTELTWAVCRQPDQLRLWYYSGLIDQSRTRPYVNMSHYWEYAVAYLAAAKLDRPVCGCSNISEFIEGWRTDLAMADGDVAYVMSPQMLSNRFGTTKGAVYAWKRTQQNGMRLNK